MNTALQGHFSIMARYNRLANVQLYQACTMLDDTEYHKERQAFFHSIHGTLNHILVADRIWLGRFEGVDSGIDSLDAILCETLSDLTKARSAEDERIQMFISDTKTDALNVAFSYHSMDGTARKQPLAVLLAHLFNHQTHHRGQVHDMLSQTHIAPPSLDMPKLFDHPAV